MKRASGGKKNTMNQEGRDEGYKQQSKKKPSSSHDSAAGRKMGTELITGSRHGTQRQGYGTTTRRYKTYGNESHEECSRRYPSTTLTRGLKSTRVQAREETMLRATRE